MWEDEHGHPLAAVWNEDPAVDSGFKDAPMTKLDYAGAEFIDLMGVKRKPAADGSFAVSSFPLFIRGQKGDFDKFTMNNKETETYKSYDVSLGKNDFTVAFNMKVPNLTANSDTIDIFTTTGRDSL